jgi:hypothetical protein
MAYQIAQHNIVQSRPSNVTRFKVQTYMLCVSVSVGVRVCVYECVCVSVCV